MQAFNKIMTWLGRQPRWRLWAVGAIVVLIAILWSRGGGESARNAPTFEARRGPLDITVLEGGSLQALEYQELKCEVRVGYQGTKILKIVDEGYLVTEADVKSGKVLCELDSSELENQIVQQEIQYQSALASLTDAEQNYEIQLSQNQSDVKAAEQKARFARMDFDKFLGDLVTEQIIQEIGLDQALKAAPVTIDLITHAAESTNAAAPVQIEGGPVASVNGNVLVQMVAPVGEPTGAEPTHVVLTPPGSPSPVSSPPPEPEPLPPPPPRPNIDFSKYSNIEVLGDGEAKQKLRKLEDDLQVAQKELGQAETALEGTRRLYERGFVPKTEITRDEISYESARLKVQTAETAQALFLKYEFVKSAEEAMSKFTEAVRELDKAQRVAISKLAQARARLNSAQGQYKVQSRRREDLQEQLAKCTMRAERPGLVVYGSGRGQQVYYGDQEPIREGATVRERQAIVTIPDLTRMSVDVRIHESYIKKVRKGLKARITVDAFPNQRLTGEVTKVAVLPDSQNRWMNPDLKVYLTTVTIDGTHDWVKPGMSAKVEMLVNHLDDVVYIPVQAVVPEGDKQICYVGGGSKPERREVEVGEFNDEFIEIKKGIAAGERILLSPPASPATVTPAAEPEPEPAESTEAAAENDEAASPAQDSGEA